MQLGIYNTGMDSAGSLRASAIRGSRLSGKNYTDAAQKSITVPVFQMTGADEENSGAAAEKTDSGKRSEASKIYEAAAAGKANPISSFRAAPKVPYGHLAKDGVITYNGVTFVCDERTNSICLGNVEDKSQVITVTLSGGGHLKVNRKNIGELSKAAGMFSPEDLNLIMRAIAQDTKIQSVKKEIDDMENSIGSAENAISGEPVSEETVSEDMASENTISGDEKNK